MRSVSSGGPMRFCGRPRAFLFAQAELDWSTILDKWRSRHPSNGQTTLSIRGGDARRFLLAVITATLKVGHDESANLCGVTSSHAAFSAIHTGTNLVPGTPRPLRSSSVGASSALRWRMSLRILLRVPARVRFLSCEPLIGRIDLSALVRHEREIDWVIAGGESGPGARPMDPSWIRSLRDFSRQLRIAFHFKQWGHWAPTRPDTTTAKSTMLTDGVVLYAVGKKLAGRQLDGQTWNQLPTVQL